jgi:hypothetical protein
LHGPSGQSRTALTIRPYRDHGDRLDIARLLRDLGRHFDLVIEDGSDLCSTRRTASQNLLPGASGSVVPAEGACTLRSSGMPSTNRIVPRGHRTPCICCCLSSISGPPERHRGLPMCSASRRPACLRPRACGSSPGRSPRWTSTTAPRCRRYARGGGAFDSVDFTCRCGVDLDVLGIASLTAVQRRRAELGAAQLLVQT